MSKNREQKLASWLERSTTVKVDDSYCTAIRLLNVDSGAVLQEWATSSEIPGKEEQRQIIETAFELCEADSESRAGSTVYQLALCFGDTKPNHVSSQRLKFINKDDDGPLEGATSRGVLSQLMRHLEKKDSVIMGLVQSHTNYLERTHAQMSEEIIKSREIHASVIEARENLADKTAEREMALEKEKQRTAAVSKFAEQVAPLLGMLSKKFLGGSYLGGGDPIAQVVVSLLKKRTAEEMGFLVELVGKEDAAPLLLMWEEIKREEATKQLESGDAKPSN